MTKTLSDILFEATGFQPMTELTNVIEWLETAKSIMDEQRRLVLRIHPEIPYGTPDNPKKMKDLPPEAVIILRRNVYAGDHSLDDVADYLVDRRHITIDKAWELLRATYQYGELHETGKLYYLSDDSTVLVPWNIIRNEGETSNR